MTFDQFCKMMGLNVSDLSSEQRSKLNLIWKECDCRNAQLGKDHYCRAFKIPKTVNAETRSVRADIITDAPTWMYDWERGWIKEILPMDTCRIPAQMPLCDTHNTNTVKAVLGSCRNLAAEQRQGLGRLSADLFFASDKDSEDAFNKVKDGHVTDMSGGYRVYTSAYVEDGEQYVLNGRSYAGPVKIALDWEPSEGSICPIGADEFSKIRSNSEKNGNISAKSAVNNDNTSKRKQEAFKMTFDQFCRKLGIDAASLNQNQRSMLELLHKTQSSLKEDSEIPADVADAAKRAVEIVSTAITEGQRAENERQTEIRAMKSISGIDAAFIDNLVADNKITVEEARKRVIAEMRKSTPPIATNHTLEAGETGLEKTIRAASHGISLRNGIKIENPDASANEFRAKSYVRVCEELLMSRGINTRSLSNEEIVSRSMSTGDFPIILSNAANLMMAQSYELSEETWRDIVEITNDVRDFKLMTVANFGGIPVFSEILEGGKYKAINFNEIGESYKVKTYGCEATATRQMIVNDSLGVFFKALESAQAGADKLIGNGVWGIITANADTLTYGDGNAHELFCETHGNLIGGADALGQSGMQALRLKFRKMKGIYNKNPEAMESLNLRLARLAVPSELEEQGRMLTENEYMIVGGVAVKNTSFGTKLTVEDRLSSNSLLDYYGFANRAPIQVAYLNGQQRPEIIRLNDRNPDNISVLARIDVGWAPYDHRYVVWARSIR